MFPLHEIRARPKIWASSVLLAAGLAGGAVLGTTMTAGAATTSTGSASSSSPGATSTPTAPPRGMPACRGLPKSGTVTAVGSDSVTIDGVVYAVNSNSDIDKNGEVALSKLAVGDKVTFSTVQSSSTPTIDKLHAGNESLDRPTGPPPGAGPAGWSPGGPPPSGAGSTSTSTSTGTST